MYDSIEISSLASEWHFSSTVKTTLGGTIAMEMLNTIGLAWVQTTPVNAVTNSRDCKQTKISELEHIIFIFFI